MRFKTLAAGMMLAFVGLAGSATHAESGSLGVQTNNATGSTLDSRAGNDQFGVSSSTQAGVEVGVDGATRTERESHQQGELQTDTRAGNRTESQTGGQYRGEAGVEGTQESSIDTGHDIAAEVSDRSRSVLEGASDTLETGRKTSEQWRNEATEASGNPTDNLGTAIEAEGSANASGELR